MMEDTDDLHCVAADPIQNPMTFADQAADANSVCRPRLAALGIKGQAFEGMIERILIGVGGLLPELRRAVIANFLEIGVCRLAQYDLSHAGRDAWR